MSDTRGMGRKAFFYGTLMAPQVLEAVLTADGTQKVSDTKLLPARLYDYSRFVVKGEVYPGIVHNETIKKYLGTESQELQDKVVLDKHVEGFIVDNLSDRDISLLDRFEGSEYQRSQVTVNVKATVEGDYDQQEQVQTYIFTDGLDNLDLTRKWDYQAFIEKEMRGWIPQELESMSM